MFQFRVVLNPFWKWCKSQPWTSIEPRLSPCVILSAAPQRTSHIHTHWRAVERSRHRFYRPCSIREFSRRMPNPWAVGLGADGPLRASCTQEKARRCRMALQRTPCCSIADDESSGSFDSALLCDHGLRLSRCAPLDWITTTAPHEHRVNLSFCEEPRLGAKGAANEDYRL